MSVCFLIKWYGKVTEAKKQNKTFTKENKGAGEVVKHKERPKIVQRENKTHQITRTKQ